MAEEFSIEKAQEAIEGGIAQAQELMNDPAKVDDLLQQIQQQIRYGWQSLQHGNTPESILQEQLAFLSKSQRKAMTDNPIPKIAEEEYTNKYPSLGLAALRQEFTAALKQYESQCVE